MLQVVALGFRVPRLVRSRVLGLVFQGSGFGVWGLRFWGVGFLGACEEVFSRIDHKFDLMYSQLALPWIASEAVCSLEPHRSFRNPKPCNLHPKP